jgi:hypothetical protein
MCAKRRSEQKNQGEREPPDPIQIIAVYEVDLMSELEGLMRSLSKMQMQTERLRSGREGGSPLTEGQRREAVKLLSGNANTLVSKVDTLRQMLPEVQKAVDALEQTLPEDEPE